MMQKLKFYIRFIKIFLLFTLLMVVACKPFQNNPTEISNTLLSNPTSTETISPTFTASSTITPTFTRTATITFTPTSTQTLSPTPSPTITATYSILRGEVNVAHVSCFYGPHKSYLYKYGLVGGSNLEIIGRNIDTNYIEIRAIGGTNPCWMNSEWMNIKGSLDTIQPINPEDVALPQSPYYGPVSGVSAIREGETVTISWNFLYISPGKDSLQFPYLVEAWICQDGKLIFSPTGSWTNTTSFTDQSGCEEKSHARVYGVEKHGYTLPVEVPWPSISE